MHNYASLSSCTPTLEPEDWSIGKHLLHGDGMIKFSKKIL